MATAKKKKKTAPAKKPVAPAKKAVVAAKKPVAPAKKPVPAKKPAVKVKETAINTRKIKPVSVGAQTKTPVAMSAEKPKNFGVPASISHKKRLVVSYSNMNEELATIFREKYPKGYADYMGDLFKVDKPDGTSFYAISIETDDAVYLIKMVVKIDRIEDTQNALFPDTVGEEMAPAEGETFPDDNTDNIADTDDMDE